jgi:hypothetical protein
VNADTVNAEEKRQSYGVNADTVNAEEKRQPYGVNADTVGTEEQKQAHHGKRRARGWGRFYRDDGTDGGTNPPAVKKVLLEGVRWGDVGVGESVVSNYLIWGL